MEKKKSTKNSKNEEKKLINFDSINRKYLSYVCICLIIIICIVFLVRCGVNDKDDQMNGLKIHYDSGKMIKFNNFKKDFTNKRTITVENTTKENKTYSLEWVKVTNDLKKQNVFLYEIECTGERCATLGKSQVPVAGAKVYTQVLIEPKSKQTYDVKFTYNGSEKGVKFAGALQVYSEKVDTKKIKEQEKKEQKKLEKQLDEEAKKNTKSKA